ncbi:MAG TPA: thioredoxin domain-containing protein [Pseudosphingobacterium sp.]|nr:thioredoxin domain-containing protein [Pseudosphingobacterium sp.]
MKQLISYMLLLLTYGALIAQESVTKLLPFEAFEKKLLAAGSFAQILDARSEEEFVQNHVKGALNVPDEKRFKSISATLRKEAPVFIYSIGNGRSAKLAAILRAQNFKEVYEFPGGLSRWIGQGKPVESSVGEGLSLATFNEQINSDKLVLVDVSSRYCGGCKKLKPIVEHVARENKDKLKLVNIEAYDNKRLTRELAVDALPTLILYKGKEVVWKKQGLSSKEEIIAQLNKHKI